jgi:hypothetical protein
VITSKNVIAVREGSQHPDQYVVYSGHWDHLGIGLPDAKGDRIYNGAVDNAPASRPCWNWRACTRRRRRPSAAWCSWP